MTPIANAPGAQVLVGGIVFRAVMLTNGRRQCRPDRERKASNQPRRSWASDPEDPGPPENLTAAQANEPAPWMIHNAMIFTPIVAGHQ